MQKILFAIVILLTGLSSSFGQQSARININGYDPKVTISRHIYGHFSEHLGRCIYDGFWVSDTSTLARKDRIRLDVVKP